MRRLLLFVVVAGIATACSTADLTFGGPLQMQLTSNAPVSVNDSLRLDYEIIGRSLLGLVVQWGDSELDSLLFAGAQSAGGRAFHSYDSAGTYTIRATVLDQIQGSIGQELTVTINP